MSVRLAIVGATGRMGQTLLRRAAATPGVTVAAAVTIAGDAKLGQDAGPQGGLEPLGVALRATIDGPCDALIEFTSPAGLRTWAAWCAARRVPLISGTTGLSAADEELLRATAAAAPVVWAPNMSIGVNLLLTLVQEAAARLGPEWDIEIVEAHHRHKVDAPSGTAKALLAAAAAGRGVTAESVAVYGRSGAPGARPAGQIGIHAVRMGAIVGEHDVHFASAAEELTLRHRAESRDTFADGALRAARWVQGRAPGLYGMRDVLFT
jgi:4-hydroxy-tetrahydrodipicolinate reductase